MAVRSNGLGVILDSRMPNRILKSAITDSLLDFRIIKEEYSYDESRLDFLLEGGREKYLTEVKSCMLIEVGRGLFPDDPTERGRRQLGDLASWISTMGKSMIVFVAMRPDVLSVSPNWHNDLEFAVALKSAIAQGIRVISLKISFEEHTGTVSFMGFVPFVL